MATSLGLGLLLLELVPFPVDEPVESVELQVLAGLLGDVHVYTALVGGEGLQPASRARSNRMRSQTDSHQGISISLQTHHRVHHSVRIAIVETSLLPVLSLPVAGSLVGDPEQGDSQTNAASSPDYTLGQLVSVGVGLAIRAVVQVVKLTNGGESRLGHL